jgi:glutathione S-transferase
MNTLTLYHFPRSSCSRKVVFVLTYKQLAYSEVLINLERGEQKAEAFLQLNPYGQVPVLQYDDMLIYDSAVINEFLEEQFPQLPLLPPSPERRALVRLAALHADREFYPQISRLLREGRKSTAERDQNWFAQALAEFQAVALAQLEAQLEKSPGPFLFGELSLADVAYAPGLDTLLHTSPLRLTYFPATAAWLAHLNTFEAFQKTRPWLAVAHS